MAKRISVKIEKCMGCHSCEIFCAVAHSSSGDLDTVIRTGERPGYRIHVEAYSLKAVPINCRHCEEAACVLVCPTGSIHRKEAGEPVLVDAERCIGCSMCVQACPFGVLSLSAEGKGALKCDLCIERLERGEEPACVTSCPSGALVYEEEEEANRAKRRRVAHLLVSALPAEEGGSDI